MSTCNQATDFTFEISSLCSEIGDWRLLNHRAVSHA
jgi:hypothetical protein